MIKKIKLVEKIKLNKRLMYLLTISVLVLFCLVLNVTFSIWSNNYQSGGANITVNDLKYRMIINEVELEDSVGIKMPSNTIIGDRIILLKSKKTEQFIVNLISLNDIDTKYEIIYKVCTDVNCTNFIDTPEDVQIAYHIDTPYVNGELKANKLKSITLVSDNKGNTDYYIQIGLNVGYSHNTLVLTNQITNDFSPASLDGNLSIIGYVNGVEVETFPTEPNYETGITCLYKDGTVSDARGVFSYSTEKGWEVDVFGLNRSLTTCRVDFTEVLQVTYEVLSTRYKCANQNTDVSSDDAILIYSGKCSTLKSDDNGWRLALLGDGILTVTGLIYIDAFLVGGGGGGSGYSGGQGGNTYYKSSIRLSDESDIYSVTIGSGGVATANGSPTSFIVGSNTYTALGGTAGGVSGIGSAGTCEFMETTDDGCKFTDNGYSGYYGGSGGGGGNCPNGSVGGTGGGGNGCISPSNCDGLNVSAGKTNTGGGGGGGGYCDWQFCWNGSCSPSRATANPADGGSGVIVIRNTRV